MPDIYTSDPLNKTAAVVVSQKGCTSHEGFTPEQHRDNWIARSQHLASILGGMGKGDPRRSAPAKEYREIQLKLTVLKKNRTSRDLKHYIIDVLKERCTRHQWDMIVEKAEKRKEKDNACVSIKT